MRSLKIGMVSLHSDPLGKPGTTNTGGMSIYIRELARHLARAGHEIDIYTQGSGQTEEVYITGNVRLIRINSGHGYIPKDELHNHILPIFQSFRDHVQKNGWHYDIIHSHYWLSGLLGEKIQAEWQIPHVITFHTMGIMKRIRSWEGEPVYRSLSERKLTCTADRIIALTGQERDSLAKYYGTNPGKIGVVSCGVNLKQFTLLSRDYAREKIGLEENAFVLLFVGRLVPVKGIHRLIGALAHLKNDPRVILLIIGGSESSMFSNLKRLARKAGIEDRIRFAGRIDHDKLPLYYNASDLLVMGSYYESFGLVALEALACGLPVIAPPVGIVKDVIYPGLTGFITRKMTPASLARTIENVITCRKEMLAREEIRTFVSDFTWDISASMLMEEYEKAIQTFHSTTERSLVLKDA